MGLDDENNVTNEVAPQEDTTQIEQAPDADESEQSPAASEAPADNEDLIGGKFKSPEDLLNAYQELERQNTRLSQGRAAQEQQPVLPPFPSQQQTPAFFEPESQQALNAWYAVQRENERNADFVRRHAEELKDPVLAGTVRRLIDEANSQRRLLDQEDALAQAKDLLDKRLQPQVKEASKDALQEGQELARRKAQAAAIGETSVKSPQKDESQMSSSEWASAMGLQRAD